jgi:predicted nucleic acid-binding protein
MVEDGARVSVVTVYELERGIRKLEYLDRGGAKRRVLDMFLEGTTIYSLDAPTMRGWFIAADLYGQAAARSPAIVFGEADLLILATALAHGMVLLTSDDALADLCVAMGLGAHVERIAVR